MKSEQKSSDKPSRKSPPYALFNLIVIVVAIFYGVYYQINKAGNKISLADELPIKEEEVYNDEEKIRLLTADELKSFDGSKEMHFICTRIKIYSQF